jgi:hypothetical protein
MSKKNSNASNVIDLKAYRDQRGANEDGVKVAAQAQLRSAFMATLTKLTKPTK